VCRASVALIRIFIGEENMDKHEALAVIRKNYPHVASSGSQFETALRELIPDLKESKDEMVRKALISLIYENSHTYKSFAGIDLDSMIAYLEKQKELDKMIVVSPEVWDNAINDAYKNGKKDGEKQKEQKGANGNEKEIPNGQKPAEWSEEDERMRNQLVYDVEYHKKEGLVSAKKYKATEALYNGIEKCYDEKIAWLKSLRPPQYCENCKLKRSVENWKPSEEQMEHLKRCFSHGKPHLPMPNQHVLESLYNDLEKL